MFLFCSRPVDEIYLVAQALAGNDGHLIAKLLVDLEVKGELGVVTLNDDLGGPLDGLCANATHFGVLVVDLESCDVVRVVVRMGNFGVHSDFCQVSLNGVVGQVIEDHMTITNLP